MGQMSVVLLPGAQIKDTIVGFHDATRFATLHTIPRCLGPSHYLSLSIYESIYPDTKALALLSMNLSIQTQRHKLS